MALLLSPTLCRGQLPAQTNSAKATLHSNRYLLIVETSRAMQRRSDGVLKAVQDLLASGMHGQLRRGDTLGLWTYNEELYAGQFPLQQWTPETHRNVAIKVLSFLKGQTYEKRANLDKAVAAMEGVIKNSEFITVILISTGEQPIQGTPLDEQINDFHKLWNAEQQKARMPFITVLRATNGKITDHSLNSAPWPVEMPPLPPLEQVAEVPATKLAPPSAKASPPKVAPLIISGKKSAPVLDAKPSDAGPKPPPPATVSPKEAPKVEASASAATPAQGSALQPRPLEPAAAQPAPTQEVASLNLPPKPAQFVSPITVPSLPPAAASTEKPKAENSPAPEIKPSTNAPLIVVQAQTSFPPPSNKALAKIEQLQTPAPLSTVGHSSSDSSVQTAVVVPAESTFGNKIVWLAAAILAAVALVFLFLTLRRTRPAAPASLITRSLDRERKT